MGVRCQATSCAGPVHSARLLVWQGGPLHALQVLSLGPALIGGVLPRAGNEAFQMFFEAPNGPRHLRINNVPDVVPKVRGAALGC